MKRKTCLEKVYLGIERPGSLDGSYFFLDKIESSSFKKHEDANCFDDFRRAHRAQRGARCSRDR